jgi:hypothetical protein
MCTQMCGGTCNHSEYSGCQRVRKMRPSSLHATGIELTTAWLKVPLSIDSSLWPPFLILKFWYFFRLDYHEYVFSCYFSVRTASTVKLSYPFLLSPSFRVSIACVLGFLWHFLFQPFFFFFWDRVSLCIPGCPGTHFVDQAGLEFRNPPASAPRVLGLKACTIMPSFNHIFLMVILYFSCYNSIVMKFCLTTFFLVMLKLVVLSFKKFFY